MSQVDESLLLEHRADSNRAQADGMPGKSLGRDRGYVGRILFGLSTPLVLGSLWVLILAEIAAPSLIVRTHLEDQTLQRELHRNILIVDDQPCRHMKCKHHGK